MKHVRRAILLASALLTAAATLPAQEKKMEAPKPGPEVKKLSYFVGTWNTTGEVKANPFMPAGKMTSLDKCEWFDGGFHVVCRSTGKGPAGPMKGLGILAYNGEDKMYTYMGIDNSGFSEMSKGTNDGNTWTYTAEEKMGGQTFKGRYTMVTSSPDSYTFKYETSPDGNQWATMMEGKTTRAAAMKAAPAEKK